MSGGPCSGPYKALPGALRRRPVCSRTSRSTFPSVVARLGLRQPFPPALKGLG